MRNYPCKGSFFNFFFSSSRRGAGRCGEVVTWVVPAWGFPTLKPASSGVCAVLEQNWDEAKREGSKWTELVWKCHGRRISSGQIVARLACHLLGFHPREQARGDVEKLG